MMKKVPLGSIVEIKKGKKVNPICENPTNKIRLIQMEDLRNQNQKKFCEANRKYTYAKKEDIIIAWDGAYAGIVNYGLEGVIGSTLALLKIKNKEEILTPYLGKFLQSKFSYLKNTRTGATIPHISRNALEKIQVPIFDPDIQKAIVEVLNKAQSLINKRKKQIALLDQLAQSLFLDMFGDLTPSNNKVNFIRLGDYSTHISSGSTPKGGRKTYVPSGIPLIRSQNVRMNQLNLDDVVYIDRSVHEKMKRSQLQYKDVLFNITGASIGRSAVYHLSNQEANVNQHVCIIRLKPEINPYFLVYYFSSKRFQDSIRLMNAGATRKALNYTQIKNFKIPYLPIALQNKFEKFVIKIEQQKQTLHSSLLQLETFSNSLMQRAFRGELFNNVRRVKEENPVYTE